MSYFLNGTKNIPSNVTWRENLIRWGTDAKIDTVGLCAKSSRKTWESWLMFYFPQHIQTILLSQGHTDIMSIEHYLNMPFTTTDRIEMKEYVEGWI